MADVPLVSRVPPDPSVEQLVAAVAERDVVVAVQVEQLAEMAAQAERLAARVAELEVRLGKNSRNSSKPPSSDDPRKKPAPRSLRRPSGRRPGTQNGDAGHRLERREQADQVVVHTPEACGGCGADLAGALVVGEQARQVFDLPAIALVVEHRAQRRACPCGQVTTAEFPAEASAPTCYGSGVAALGAYLLGRQHLPVARTAELMSEVLSAPVSTGYLAGLLGQAQGADRFHGPGPRVPGRRPGGALR